MVMIDNNSLLESDRLEIIEDTREDKQSSDTWKIIIADDESEVHRITSLVLKNFKFENRGLNILSAYSEAEVKELIRKNPDTSVIFLDVIMERDDSGLNVVKYIRNELKNRNVRIILRTGQPGQAPEEQTIVNYDINDYKEKTELTSKKLYTSLITALRTYCHLTDLERSKKGLEEIISSTTKIFRLHKMDSFYNVLLKCLISIVSSGKNSVMEKVSGLIGKSSENSDFYTVSGVGEFSSSLNASFRDILGHDDYDMIIESLKKNPCYFSKNSVAIYFKAELQFDILVYIKSEHDFCEIEQSLLSIFYSNVKISLNNMHLINEIESTQKEILYTLGGIAEARSKELGQHVIRVAEFARIIALGYGLSDEEAEIIRQAAPMHDIGKIAIPDEVLNKPGKLTPEEFEIIKTHTLLGYDLLKNSNRKTLKAAAIIALQHHEKYNGTGYPNKLKGDQIHIYGRISSIADVFDALGCDRVYKKAWELDKILELFLKESGQHFDPVLVDILFKNLDKIIKVKNSLPD
jgi:response regulator RpfG family c-di-GMP phosphodiesterase